MCTTGYWRTREKNSIDFIDPIADVKRSIYTFGEGTLGEEIAVRRNFSKEAYKSR